jgi:predicted RNA-binding Zn ribbon-like protein
VKTPQLALVPGQLELVRPPAPGQLELVRHFLNTLDRGRGVDALATPESYTRWLREYALLDRTSEASAAETERARELRENLRAMARNNNGIPCACDAGVLAKASERAKLSLDFDPAGGVCRLRSTASGADAALGTILAAVHTAMLERSWSRLKVCADDTCDWGYFDHSKNGCSRWCSAETCGNRNKVRRYRERQAKANDPVAADGTTA